MNCTACQDSGVYREAGSPPEVCTCQDATRFNAEARAHFPTATVADLLQYGGFSDALVRVFRSALPRNAEWSNRRVELRVENVGLLRPDNTTRLIDLVILAKFNPEAAA